MMVPAVSSESRRANLERLKQETFDVLILGGGINGAGVARDLALRARAAGAPLRVALIEKRHFASGTSGKNSQLIHGGLRYLKQLDFRLVREALHERATLLRIAPHLVEPQPFLIPFYGWFNRVFYGAGLWFYDLLAGRENIGRRRYLSLAAVAEREPEFATKGLNAAAIFFDCRVNSARFVLENLFDAAREGVVIANYTRADAWSREGGQFQVKVTDTISGEAFDVRARKLVDAMGPWHEGGDLRLVRGSHLILPRVNASESAIAHFGGDGRIIFVIPWGSRGQLSLVGTTDVDHSGGPDEVRISPDEARYLLDVVRRLFPTADKLTPLAAYSSLRPLLKDDSGSATKASREHRIWNSPDGVLHIAGGKYTTYRVMSAEAVDAVAQEIAPQLVGRCSTADVPLGGNSREQFEELLSSVPQLAGRHELETDDVNWLVRSYGVLAPSLLACLPDAGSESLSRLARAVIVFAVRHEMSRRLPDLAFVSTYWGYEQNWSEEALRPLAAEMGRHLGWSQSEIGDEVQLVLRIRALPA